MCFCMGGVCEGEVYLCLVPHTLTASRTRWCFVQIAGCPLTIARNVVRDATKIPCFKTTRRATRHPKAKNNVANGKARVDAWRACSAWGCVHSSATSFITLRLNSGCRLSRWKRRAYYHRFIVWFAKWHLQTYVILEGAAEYQRCEFTEGPHPTFIRSAVLGSSPVNLGYGRCQTTRKPGLCPTLPPLHSFIEHNRNIFV